MKGVYNDWKSLEVGLEGDDCLTGTRQCLYAFELLRSSCT